MLKTVGVTALIIAVVAVLAVTGRKSVHAEAFIAVPPNVVWETVTDASSYPAWNPILVKADGVFEQGSTMRYQMKIGDADPTPVAPVIKQLVVNELLHQGGGMTGVLTYDHQWRFEPVTGGTKVVQHEVYTGFGVWFWDPSCVEQQYQNGLEALMELLENG